MRWTVLAAAICGACSHAPAPSLSWQTGDGQVGIRNDSSATVEVAEGSEGLNLGLEIFDAGLGAWRWYGARCRHHVTGLFRFALAPGEELENQAPPQPESPGKYRYVTAWRHPGGTWQWLASEEFDQRSGLEQEPSWERTGYGSWRDSALVTLRVSNVRPYFKGRGTKFLFDLQTENASEVEISYNVTSNYWWCEEAGRWYAHPGYVICGNSAHPVIAAGQSEQSVGIGKEWGRIRFGMRFESAQGGHWARSEPFEVPREWTSNRPTDSSD